MDSEQRSSIAERRELVEEELTAAAGGASLCSISRSAGPVPGVKHLEGRLAVLMRKLAAHRVPTAPPPTTPRSATARDDRGTGVISM